MTDELLPWNELPVRVRRSRRLLYEYQRTGEIPGPTPEPTPDPEPETVDIAVTVTSGSDPVSGVAVAIGEITGTTGGQGGCTLSNVPVGNATVTANKEGYAEYSQPVTITDATETLEIELNELQGDI